MRTTPERYRLYLDESGDHVFHDEGRLAEPGHRYLALVGCWFAQGETYRSFQRALEDLKQRHLPHSPDEPVILHRKEIINRSGPFWRLRETGAREAFDGDLIALLSSCEFTVVGLVVDKLVLAGYADVVHPYDWGFSLLLERYCGWLNHANRQGDVMGESRGGTEDKRLKEAYRRVWSGGTRHHDERFFQLALSSKDLKLKRKSENLAGLQVADLLAHAIKDDILDAHGRLGRQRAPFEHHLMQGVRHKYLRRISDGRIEGWGIVLAPNKKGPPKSGPFSR